MFFFYLFQMGNNFFLLEKIALKLLFEWKIQIELLQGLFLSIQHKDNKNLFFDYLHTTYVTNTTV